MSHIDSFTLHCSTCPYWVRDTICSLCHHHTWELSHTRFEALSFGPYHDHHCGLRRKPQASFTNVPSFGLLAFALPASTIQIYIVKNGFLQIGKKSLAPFKPLIPICFFLVNWMIDDWCHDFWVDVKDDLLVFWGRLLFAIDFQELWSWKRRCSCRLRL